MRAALLIRWAAACCLAGTIFAFVGCGGESAEVYPVRGQVFYLDKPCEGAQVVFQPAGDAAPVHGIPEGTVGPDGSFTLQTHPHGPGAPPGEYVVLVSWYPPNARDLPNPVNRLPAKYSELGATPLRATVKPGDNELPPFQLAK